MGRPTSRARIRLLLGSFLVLGACAAAADLAGAQTSTTRSGKSVGFEPAAVSFVSPARGWVLGRTGCSDCAGIRLTTDGGRHWERLPSPEVRLAYYSTRSVAISDIVFANATDGFLFGPGLLTTHDGGRSWQRQSLPPVLRMSVGAGYAFALTRAGTNGRVTLWRARIGHDDWTRLVLPTKVVSSSSESGFSPELAVNGREVVLLRPGSRGPATSAAALGQIRRSNTSGTSWQARAVPCTPMDGGAALLAISRGHPHTWLVDCFDDEQSSQKQDTRHRLYRSTDAGASWTLLAAPTRHNQPTLLADSGAGHVLLATEGGAGDSLVGSLDGGRHWRPLVRSGGSFFGWADLQFLTAEVGYVVGPTHYAPEHLYRTSDGGRSWQAVRIG